MRTESETGDDGSDNHPDSSDPHHLESSQSVSDEERQDGTTESSGFVNSCCDLIYQTQGTGLMLLLGNLPVTVPRMVPA